MKHQHNRRKITLQILVFSILAIFVLLIGSYEFLHNHPIDHHDHEDCPAHIFSSVLASIYIFILFFVIDLLLFEFQSDNSIPQLISHEVSKLHQSRAPPLL